ncbi:MAG: hypothetical protein ACNYPD_08520 [Candidatus Halichondribacter symbioticus]
MSKFLLPILAGIAMVIVSGCGGAGAPTTDGTDTDTDGDTNSAGQTPEQIEAKRLADLRAKLLTDETTACGATCASYANWLTANPDLLPVPIEAANRGTTNNIGHYLQGTATGLAGNAVVTTVTFEDAFDDDNSFDGFAYFDGVEKRRYVGILSDTNMGAPLTTTAGRAIWKGFISGADAFATPTAFDLTVIFNTTGGTINAFIPTNIPANNPRFAFRILGEFDAKGVITGTTDRRTYTDLTDVTTYDASSLTVNTEGTLRGLIGSDGAVGVFTTDAEDANVPYAGGFVAKPNPLAPLETPPDHALYVGVFSPLTSLVNLGTQETVDFAQPTAEGFSIPEIRFEDSPTSSDCGSCFPNFIVRLGGNNTDTNDTDGFALIYGRLIDSGGGSARARAGLLPGTDLGASFGNVAPDGATTANWPGTLYYSTQLSGTAPTRVVVPFNVVFNVDFAAGTFLLPDTILSNRGQSNQQTIKVEGRFGSHVEAVDRAETPAPLPPGVLGGFVNYQNGLNTSAFRHDLQGLIGTEGAVGIFRVGNPNFTIGGFVAQNTPVPVNHAGYLTAYPSLRVRTPNSTLKSSFVQGLENSLDISNVNFKAESDSGTISSCATECVETYLVRLGGNNANAADLSGFAFFYGNNHSTNINGGEAYRVGLLSGTDVGNALPELAPDGRATAVWSGKVHTTLDATDGTITPRDLTLTVNYATRKISGQATLSDGVLSVNNDTMYGLTGVIEGDVTYDPTNGADIELNLVGVIGTEGAIGVFEGKGDAPHAGGFIAKP